MKNILITAYAVNPYKGSEDGTGWNISRELAKHNNVIVVTRKNNRPEIERFYEENPDLEELQNLSFKYYDLPSWLVFWKKKIGERGYVLYFYLWQLFMPLFIKRSGVKFDVAHALNFHSDSHPHFLWVFGKPVFWGPIGHHPKVPKEFILEEYGYKDLFKDRLYNTVKFIMRNFDPFYYIAKWRTTKIFTINSKVNEAVKAKAEKITILPAVASNRRIERKKSTSDHFEIISVGRFTYMKGFDVVIKAFAQFLAIVPPQERSQVRLKIIGKGENETTLNRIIAEEGLKGHVEIVNWVSLEEMFKLYDQASVFAFASHEGAGMVVPEALSFGLPVVCFNNEGPGELCSDKCAIRIPVTSYEFAIQDFASAFYKFYSSKDLLQDMSAESKLFSQRYTWQYKAQLIQEAYYTEFQKQNKSITIKPAL